MLAFSRLAATFSNSAPSTPGAGFICVTESSPVVSVPVLSNTIAVRFRACSRLTTLLIKMPSRAAQDSAATIAVGVARISAHGQATTSILIAVRMPSSEGVKYRTMPAIIRIVGVYQLAYWSISFIKGILVRSALAMSS